MDVQPEADERQEQHHRQETGEGSRERVDRLEQLGCDAEVRRDPTGLGNFHRMRFDGRVAVPRVRPTCIGPRESQHGAPGRRSVPDPEEVGAVTQDVALAGMAEMDGPFPNARAQGLRSRARRWRRRHRQIAPAERACRRVVGDVFSAVGAALHPEPFGRPPARA